MTEKERIEFISKNSKCFKLLKEEDKTYAVCLAAVSQDGNTIIYVPKQHRTYELLFAACENNGSVLSFVPDIMKDAAICHIAVSSFGMSLRYVPENLLTSELCKTAVYKDAEALQFVPKSMITGSFCADIMRDRASFDVLQWLPEDVKKAAFYEDLIRSYPDAIFSFPKKYRTAKLCKLATSLLGYPSIPDAIHANNKFFDCLPVPLLDHDACLAYVESLEKINVSKLSQPISKILISEDICECALKKDGDLLEYVPRELRTYNLCRIAVCNSYRAFRYVPSAVVTAELCDIAFQGDPHNVWYIPEKYLDVEKCKIAVTHNGRFLERVPEEMRTKEVCDIALRADIYSLLYVPEQFLSREIILTALKGHIPPVYSLVHRIPEDFWDFEMFQAVLAQESPYADVISLVPENKRTYEMYFAAVKKYAAAAIDLPAKFQSAEIYQEAVHGISHLRYANDFRLVKSIPKTYMTDELWDEIRKNVSIECLQHLVPIEKRKPAFLIQDGILKCFMSNCCTDVTIPSDAKTVPSDVLHDSYLEQLTAAEGVETFGQSAFRHCPNLKRLCFSSTVRDLSIFFPDNDLPALREINVAENNPYFASVDGVLYNKDVTELIYCPQNYQSERFVIPDSVTTIKYRAFYNCATVREICLPDHTLELEGAAFQYCKNLKKINLPKNLTKVSYELFYGSGIETIDLPQSVKEIQSHAFSNSSLISIELPNALQKIEKSAFEGCPLKKIQIPKSVRSYISSNTFSNTEIEYETALVPGGYLLFGTDSKALDIFTYCQQNTDHPLGENDYLDFLSRKTILNKHYVFIAFLRTFIFNNDLPQELKDTYVGIVKSQKKRLLQYFVDNSYNDYINILLTNKLATQKDVAAITANAEK